MTLLGGSHRSHSVRVRVLLTLERKGKTDMPVYMVDRELPGITMDELAAAQRAAIEATREFTANGKPVRYIRSMFVPGESHCMCLFEAPTPDLVREVNEAAQIPFTRVTEAVDLTPPS